MNVNLYQLVMACPVLGGRVEWDVAAVRQPEPYAVLHAGPETTLNLFHGGARLVQQTLNVSLFHAPGEQTPSPEKLLAAYEWLSDRTGYLNTAPTGRRYTVVKPGPVPLPPGFDPATQGLQAHLSFNVQFVRPELPRGVKP